MALRQNKILVAAGALALLLLLSPIRTSAAETIIKAFEGLRLKAYWDAGSYAIGYGMHYNYDRGRPVISTDIISAPTALKWLKIRNAENEAFLSNVVKVPINQNQTDSLLSLIYNIGTANFKKSNLLVKLNAGRPKKEVANEFDYFNKSEGVINKDLVKRRAIEKQIFLK